MRHRSHWNEMFVAARQKRIAVFGGQFPALGWLLIFASRLRILHGCGAVLGSAGRCGLAGAHLLGFGILGGVGRLRLLVAQQVLGLNPGPGALCRIVREYGGSSEKIVLLNSRRMPRTVGQHFDRFQPAMYLTPPHAVVRLLELRILA